MQQAKKNTLGFLFSEPVDMDRVQGESSSLVLVRERGSDGVGTRELWLDAVLSGIPVLEGHGALPQLWRNAEGLARSA